MSKAYGIDCSHWEGTIDWKEASQHVDFCIMKATDYPPFVDSEYMNNRTGCILNNVPWGVYHFYQPAIDPIDQAEHFIGVVGSDAPVYVADVEADTAGDWSPLLKDFLDRVEQLTGKKPMIYTSPYKWESFFPTPPWTDKYDLWVAHWGVQDPTLPKGWTDYVIHQVGDKGDIPGIPGAVDEDYFNGDLNAVWDYFGHEISPPPPPPPQYKLVKITAKYLNMRATPYGTKVGMLRKGNILLVTKTVQDGGGRDWYYSGDHGCFASWWSVPYE
jgi:lysozyme